MFPLAGILYDHVVNNQNRNIRILLCVDVCICVCLSMCVHVCRHVCVYSRGQCQVPSSIDHHILVRRDLSNSLQLGLSYTLACLHKLQRYSSSACPAVGIQDHSALPIFYVGAGN